MWFEVIGDRYDWMVPGKRSMVSYPGGRPHFGTRACVERGIELGLVKKIKKPVGWSVGKNGRAVKNA